MAVTVETLEKLQRKITLSVPIGSVHSEVAARLKKLARTTKMDGFRPGKVPSSVIAQRYGESVHFEVMNEKVSQAFAIAVEEAQLRVAGHPRIAQTEGGAEDQAEFEAIFEVFPEVKIGDLSGTEVEKLSAEVDEAAIDKTLDILRKQRRTFSDRPADEAASDGDRVTVDFEGKIDGEVFAGGAAQDFQFLVGEGQMLQEFEGAVRGMKAGESKTFPLSFPEDYHGKDVAGKTADFLVTLKKIEQAHLPEVDEEFVKLLGLNPSGEGEGEGEGGVEALRKDIQKNLEREVKFRLQARNKQAVMEALLSVSELDLPSALVQSEVQRLMESARVDLEKRGLKGAASANIPQDVFMPQAERRVRLGLVLSEVVKANDLEATEEQLKAHVEELAASYEEPQEVVRWYFGSQQRLAEVEAVVVENNVTEFVLGKAKVSEKPVSFEELMGQA